MSVDAELNCIASFGKIDLIFISAFLITKRMFMEFH